MKVSDPSVLDYILTLVMQSRARRKVRKAVQNVKSFLFLLRILKSSVRPVMTASMPPIWWTQTERQRHDTCEYSQINKNA